MFRIGIIELVIVVIIGVILLAAIGVIGWFASSRKRAALGGGKICPRCGTTNPGGNAFCGKCGESLLD